MSEARRMAGGPDGRPTDSYRAKNGEGGERKEPSTSTLPSLTPRPYLRVVQRSSVRSTLHARVTELADVLALEANEPLAPACAGPIPAARTSQTTPQIIAHLAPQVKSSLVGGSSYVT